MLVYLVTCFIPDIPHPILIVYEDQGSAKSTLSKLLKRLIDPSVIEVSEFPRNTAELIQKLSHHWFVFFDNISHLSGSTSDILCKAVTGGGFSKRELYSDDEDIIYTFKRCVGLNGINLIATKPDLLDRSIIFEMERIPKDKRRLEKKIKEFEKELPGILGDIFNIISKTMRIKPDVKFNVLPRMADFALWGCAIAQAMGYSQDQFLTAYYHNIESQNKEVVYGSLEAMAIMEFMKDRTEWEGTPSQLLETLKKTADNQGANTDKEKSFPKAANVLSKRLNQLKPNLAESGMQIMRKDGSGAKIICLRKDAENTILTDQSSLSPQGSSLTTDGTTDDSVIDVESLPL